MGPPLSFVQHQLGFVLVHFVSWQQISTDWAMHLESSQFYRLEHRDGWADIGKTFTLVNVCVALTKEFIPFIFLSAEKSQLWVHMWHTVSRHKLTRRPGCLERSPAAPVTTAMVTHLWAILETPFSSSVPPVWLVTEQDIGRVWVHSLVNL